MENPQAQMPQGQPGPSPEQMQQMQQGASQGQPQQGGQDPQMQQIMQYVQQSIQQGAQPVDVAIQLIQQGAQPEMIMQVFVQMGMPEDQAREAIEDAMEGGEQEEETGEETLEGNASNPDAEMAEQGAQPMDQPGNVAETPMMRFGGMFSENTARRLKNKKNVVINNYTINGQPQEDENYIGGGYAPDAAEDVYYNPGLRTSAGNAMFPNNGDASTPPMKNGGRLRRYENGAAVDPNQELQTVMQQVQEMMQGGADARQVMEQIQAAAQQGKISPDVATSVMEQLSGMQQAENPQGSDAAMMEQSQDPQQMDPNVAAPEAQMMKFGGNLRKLMTKAYGGDAIPPSIDSKNYAQDRTAMFVNSVKNNAFKSTLDNEFPSLSGNQMMYGGNLPKAVDGFDVTKYKTADEAELAAYRYRQGLSPEEQAKFDVGATLKTWKAPEPTYEAGKNYQYDPATKQFKTAASNPDDGYVRDANGNVVGLKFQSPGYGATNPVAYQNPMGNGLYGNLYAGASPFARMVSGIGRNNMYDPRITGANLPGGMNAEQFLGAIGGVDRMTSGMTGTVGDQTWRVGAGEKFKEGSIWKGNRRKGVRYQIDWGNAAAMNPAGPQNAPTATTTTDPAATTTTNQNSNTTPLITLPPSGNNIPMGENTIIDSSLVTNNAGLVTGPNNQPLTSDGSNMMWNSGNMPTLQNPNPITTANQTLVSPGATDVVNPASEVNQVDQNLSPEQQQAMRAVQMLTGQISPQYDPNAPSATGQDLMNIANNSAPQYSDTPQTFDPAQREANQQAEATRLANQKAQEAANAAKLAQQQAEAKRRADAQRQTQNNQQPIQNNQKPTQQTNTANVDYSKIKAGQPAAYYQKILEGMQVDGRVPWGPNEKEYFRIIDLANSAEKAASWNKKADYAQTLFSPVSTSEDPTHEKWTEADMNAWRAGTVGKSHEENKKAYLASKEGKKWIASLKPKSFGGNVDPVALENAVALINRAFGGMIPRADDGMDLGSEDTDGNGIPDYLQAENLPANQPNPFANKGTIEESAGKKLDINWNQVGAAAGDMYMNGATKVTNFMNKMNAMNPERDMAKFSALNRPSNTYDTMKQGLYGQQGDFIPNDIGNQVLNPTDTYYNNQRQIFSFGGKVYEIGGQVDLDDNELAELAAAGFKLSKV